MDKKSSYEVTSLEDQIRRITSWVVDIILAALLAFFLTWAFGTRVTMVGNSMDPLLSGGDSLMINRLKNRLTEPQRFDIAAYTLEGDDSVYLKLVMGLPGETIQIKDGRVYVNNQLLEDERMAFSVPNAGIAEEPVVLGADEYFVIGRSPDASRDSRFSEVGNIRREQIMGTVWLRCLPLGSFGFVAEPKSKEET